MTNRKLRGPSHFCEWVVGTTIESALGPIPKSKPPKNRKREVVRVEVTTDDESEEDTVRITYPRTGRTVTPPPPDPEPESEPEPEPTPVVTEAKTVIKKVRFQDGPIKSALKQTVITTPVESSDETSESGTESESEPESDSSQSETLSSSDATDSDAESSDNSSKQKKKRRRKRKQRQKQIEADSESDWDSDPDPTCKKKSKEQTPPSPETSESESEAEAEEPPKHKQKLGKSKKKGIKKVKEPDSDASDSAKDTSESEPETPPPKKQQQSNKKQKQGKQGKQKGKKTQESTSEPETSEPEPDPPKKNKKQQQKANTKKGAKKAKKPEPDPEPEETDGETSESAKETEDEAEPEEERPKQQNKGKQKNNKKQNAKQAEKANDQPNKNNRKKQKAEKETNKEPETPEEPEAQEQAAEATKEKDQGKSRNMTGKEKAQPKYKDGVKKDNYPEGLPGPHMRRPQLIEPIRAQVVQTERVIETPEDPAPNAYYDPEHNIMRVYHGPVYGNRQSNALYPERNGFTRPLPMGTPHPLQNHFYYGFNNPKQYPSYSQMSPYHQHYAGVPPPEAYPHVPITQGVPPPPWYAMGGPPGPPGPPPAPTSYQEKTAPASSKDKASQNNNVGPPSLTGKDNPYLPKRNKSQFSAWGSQGARTASKEHSQPAGSVRAGSNTWGGSNNNDQGNTWNDGAGDQNTQNDQGGWDTTGQDNNNNSNNGNDNGGSGDGGNQNGDWATTTNDKQAVTDWDNGGTQETTQNDTWAPETTQNDTWGSGSNKSNETVRKAGDHWGNDTFPGASGDWEQPKDGVSSVGQGADNNVGVWGADDGNGNGNGSGNGNENEPPVSTGGDGGADNVMPGTWVETPALSAGPDWGDSTAAQETNGAADNW